MALKLHHLVARSSTGEIALTHPSVTIVRQSLIRTLQENQLCSLATVNPDGRAHINTAYFAYSRDLALCFLSHPKSRHCRNLQKNGSAAIAVFRSDQLWGGHDRGVQLIGRARWLGGAARARAEAMYSTRFPLYQKWVQARAPAGRMASTRRPSYAFYEFRPTSVVVFDEESFGTAPFVTATVGTEG
jgi:uncharacterized protein YhbP (UPF0306 family)